MSQQEFFGFGTIKKIGDITKGYDAENIFLVCGKTSFSRSGAEEKIKPFLKDVDYTVFDSFTANPDVEEVKQGIALFKKTNPDLVIAIGGGSVIDMAKSVNILSAQENKPEDYITGKKQLQNHGKPLIAIPTTSGTGSESTYFATLYINKVKYSLGDKKFTLPNISIVDPDLTMSMPKYLTASTGLDALCQGIESMWAVGSTDESRKYARVAIENAFNNLEKAVNSPDDKSREYMAKAAHYSGKAICISKTTACHSISYPITSFFKIPHGHAVALTIPELIVFNSEITEKDCNDKRGKSFVNKQLKEIINLIGCKDATDAKETLKNLMKKIDVETKLSKLNIDKEGIKLIIKKGFTPDRMNNNPRKVTKESLQKILERISWKQ